MRTATALRCGSVTPESSLHSTCRALRLRQGGTVEVEAVVGDLYAGVVLPVAEAQADDVYGLVVGGPGLYDLGRHLQRARAPLRGAPCTAASFSEQARAAAAQGQTNAGAAGWGAEGAQGQAPRLLRLAGEQAVVGVGVEARDVKLAAAKPGRDRVLAPGAGAGCRCRVRRTTRPAANTLPFHAALSFTCLGARARTC